MPKILRIREEEWKVLLLWNITHYLNSCSKNERNKENSWIEQVGYHKRVKYFILEQQDREQSSGHVSARRLEYSKKGWSIKTFSTAVTSYLRYSRSPQQRQRCANEGVKALSVKSLDALNGRFQKSRPEFDPDAPEAIELEREFEQILSKKTTSMVNEFGVMVF